MIRHYALAIAILAPFNLHAAKSSRSAAPPIVERLRSLPLAFEKNNGQAPAAAEFVARGAGYGVALSHGNAHISLQRGKAGVPAAIDLRLAGARNDLKATGRKGPSRHGKLLRRQRSLPLADRHPNLRT